MKRGRHLHGDGITVNKKVQTGESSKAGVSLRFDAPYPLDNGGSFAIDAREVPAMKLIAMSFGTRCIIYQLHVKAFADSNNDGIGDFAGLTEKLGYCRNSASPPCGCCRLLRPAAMTATTSPTMATSIPISGL